MLATHGVGSRIGPVGLGRGCQWPGAEFGIHGDDPNRPSPSLASIIAWAAAFPAAIPCVLAYELGIAASEAA